MTMANKPTIGFVGLGRLGTPLAVSIASQGYTIYGHDVNPAVMKKQPWPHREAGPDGDLGGEGFQPYFDKADLRYASLREVVDQADILFIAVQTPHHARYEGITRLPWERADFDYTWLREASAQVAKFRKPNQTIVVVSTALPGTMRREILPILPGAVYNPAFPAMGTVMRDFLYPEFVLIGGDDAQACGKLTDFYQAMLPEQAGHGFPLTVTTSTESAELIKVGYNLFISFKIAYANTLMEIAHKTPGCNIQEVTDVMSLANRRLLSPAYMAGGVGDGGACLDGETLINTEHGMLPIKYLAEKYQEVKVWTHRAPYYKSPELCKAVSIRKTRENAKLIEVTVGTGHAIRCTPDHQFMTELGAVEAWDLSHRDLIRGIDHNHSKGINVTVESTRFIPGRHDVYCMEVPETGWFFANHILVKNCHPRDAIAMSWLAEKLKLSCNLFDNVMHAREYQAEWLIDLLCSHGNGMKKVILGKAYKPESAITTGSCALLMANLLRDRGEGFIHYDPLVDGSDGHANAYDGPAAYLIATQHECFASVPFPKGSIVIDPFRYVHNQDGVRVVPVGVGR